MTTSSVSPLKRCSKCRAEFPATNDHFHRNKNSRDGLASLCKSCAIDRANAHYVVNHPGYKRWGVQRQQPTRVCTACSRELPQTEEFFRFRPKKNIFNSACRECEVAYNRERREKRSPGYVLELEKNRDRLRERTLNDPEFIEANKTRARIWAKENPGKVRARNFKRRNLVLASETHFTQADVNAQYVSQDGKCAYCGTPLNDDFEIDHYIPVSRGGSNGKENIRCACQRCNRAKQDKMPDEWQEYLTWLLQR
jgi:5-methylcytosine-specific restriction endonuclease McrA